MSFLVLLFVSVQLGDMCVTSKAESLNDTGVNTIDRSQTKYSYEATVCPFTEIEDIEDAPYFVRLCTPRQCFCAGAILSDDWVISAGHCVYKKNIINVYSGHASPKRAVKHSVVHVALHPRFGVRHGFLKIRNNIALLRIEPAFAFSETTAKVDIAIHPPIEGVTYPVFSMGNGTIRRSNVTVLPHAQCKVEKKVPGRTYCSDGCHVATDFETGGPMVDNHEALGIVSFGESPLRSTFAPGVVYVQLCDYIQWIEEVIASFKEVDLERSHVRAVARDP